MSLDGNEATLAEAGGAYRQAIKGAPEWIDAHINLGTALYHLKRLEESRAAFCAAIRIDGQHALAHFTLGCICDRLGDYDQAVREFRVPLTYGPEMPAAPLNLRLVYAEGERKGAC